MLLISMEIAAGLSLSRQDRGNRGQIKKEGRTQRVVVLQKRLKENKNKRKQQQTKKQNILAVPDVLPIHRLEERMTLDLLHTHSSNPVLSISAIPETHTHTAD